MPIAAVPRIAPSAARCSSRGPSWPNGVLKFDSRRLPSRRRMYRKCAAKTWAYRPRRDSGNHAKSVTPSVPLQDLRRGVGEDLAAEHDVGIIGVLCEMVRDATDRGHEQHGRGQLE